MSKDDPAYGGHFVVIDRRPTRWNDVEDFHVKGFDAKGNLLLFTWHTGEYSMLMEVRCWLDRGARPVDGEALKATNQVRAWS